MEIHFLHQIIASLAVALILGLLHRLYGGLVAAPRRLRQALKQQGVGGPPPAFLLGNVLEMKRSSQTSAAAAGPPAASHNCGAIVFSVFDEWRRQYGDIYTFSLGNKPILLVNKYDVAKEITTSTSLHLGRPSYVTKDMESLLGNGIVTSDGELWAYQRKILAPPLFNHKVKEMTDLILQSALMLIESWKSVIDGEGGKADINIEEDFIKYSGDVISRACFGSSYAQGEQIFQKLRAIQQINANKGFSLGIPGMRYIPTKHNRREWELQRELEELILQLVKQETETNSDKNLLQMILEGAESQGAMKKFIIDNCKNIYLAGYETTAAAACWCLMLLASNPEWQDRVREEVFGVCRGKLPDSESIKQMKELTMVINETMRLYPPTAIFAREALNEIEFGNIRIPKGVGIWVLVTALHTDPEIWGPDSYEFKPERFANGVGSACKLPHMFMPFGVGPRNCLGMNLAMVKLKMLLALILSNFSISLSPKYVHAPTLLLNLKPGHGVDLVIERLKP